jgi:predicted MFS family arabinose efflux permease
MNPRAIILLVAAVQFVNILDFMMVMPLGPDFAVSLGIPTSWIGVFGGAYTVSAAVAGLAGARFLDRFDRRQALGVCMLGLAAATALGGLSTGMWTLIAARLLAGAFGGPATSVALAIVADVVPPAQRGKAMGTVMTAFSLASIIGVPIGLKAAEWFGWRAPFFGVGTLGLGLTALIFWLLPSLRGHIQVRAAGAPAVGMLRLDGLSFLTLANTALVMLGVFAVVPNISTFLQLNLGYPRERLDVLYFIGGTASFIANRAVGALVDRFGATRLIVAGTAIFAVALYFGFVDPVSSNHIIYVFPLLMLSATVRGVPIQTLASRVPPPAERARFMSALNAVQHLSSAAGATGASLLLTAEPGGRLLGMASVSIAAIGLSFLVPVVSWFIERGVLAREQLAAEPVKAATV